MASGTSDLQRDLGGAIMQSILGAVLTAGYSASIAMAVADSPNKDKITDSVAGGAPEVVLERGRDRRAVPEVRRPDHRRRAKLVSGRRPPGLPGGNRRDPPGRGDRPSSGSRRKATRLACIAEYAAEDAKRPRRGQRSRRRLSVSHETSASTDGAHPPTSRSRANPRATRIIPTTTPTKKQQASVPQVQAGKEPASARPR